MPITSDLSQVKKTNFHHRVKNFYYKNLFRKIYTVAIVGLIAANVFSLLKYQTFADEYESLQPAQEMDYLDTEGLQNADIQYTDVAGNVKYIMAKNLGATSSNINSPDSYGNFYQWGNDYAYPRYVDSEFCDLDELDEYGNGRCPLSGFIEPVLLPEPPVSLSAHSIDDSNPAPSDYDRFNDYWISEEENDGGYWWDEGEQGPCPDGYYIPTANEWSNLFVQRCEDSDICDTRDLVAMDGYYWILGNGGISEESLGNGDGANNIEMDMIVNAFMQEYKLPLAGWRDNNQVNGSNFNSAYWSSTFGNGEYNPTRLNLLPSNGAGIMRGDGYYGSSIRCIAGEYDADKDPIPLAIDLYLGKESPTDEARSLSTSSLDIYPDGWMGRIFIPADQPIPASKIAKLDIGYTWYTEYGYEIDLDSDEWSGGISLELYEQLVDPDTQTLHLYGFTSCGDDEQYVKGECVPVKWGTTVNDQGNYECLAEGATYDEASGQCVYTAKNINGNTITLMSSNLGATEFNPMGDFYQWGNDRRYPRICEGNGWCQLAGRDLQPRSLPEQESDDNGYNNSDYGRFSEYWNYEYTWTGSNKQGPCPEGYHVPTSNEWTNLLIQWCEDSKICDTRDLWNVSRYGYSTDWYLAEDQLHLEGLGNGEGLENSDIKGIIESFMIDYNLLPAGMRGRDGVDDVDSWGYYWSSTPILDYGRVFKINSSYRVGVYNDDRDYGHSVRCFKDSNDENLQTVALDILEAENVEGIENGDFDIIGRIFVANGQSIPSFKKYGLDQYRWYMYDDNDELQQIDINAKVFSVNMDEEPAIPLFALPLCDEDEEWDATTNTCRTACLGKGSTYDAEADLCYYTATDLDGNEMKIMDANLGATRANPMGDFFQWGNDWMYPRYTSYGCNFEYDSYCPLDGGDLVPGSLPEQNHYNGDYEYYHSDYGRFSNYWSYVDEYTRTGNAIQGPCPSGYHVPTIDERQNLFISWCEKNSNCDAREMINYWQDEGWMFDDRTNSFNSTIGDMIERCREDECDMEELMYELNYYIENEYEYKWLFSDYDGNGKYENMVSSFMSDYNLSLAGYRSADYVYGVSALGSYWSSTSIDNNFVRFLDIEPLDFIGVMDDFGRDGGQPVRCIANEKRSSTPIALDLFIGGDDTDEELYLENADWVGRKFVGSGSSIDVNKLTAVAVDLPSPDEGMEWVWYLTNSQDEAERVTASTRISENTKVYAFQEQKAPAPSTPTPTYTPSHGGSSGGGRTGVTKTDEDKTHGSADDKQPETQKEPEKQDTPKIPEVKPWENLVDNISTTQPNNSHGSALVANTTPAPTYTAEFKSAYSFAKTYGITNKETIQDAKMYTELTRIQMAKMLSQYAINVLGQTPDYSRGVVSFNDVSNKLNKEYDNAVTLAYQLGIMGINMKNNNFRPRDTVTRAEFATALSRMLYGLEDGKGKTKYYEPHIAKLYNEGIINNTNAKMTEKRGYVMTMLMRTVK